MRCYHSFLVEVIVENVNLIQMSKQKTIITMMEHNYVLIKKSIATSKHRRKSFISQETKDPFLTKTALKGTSNEIFNMKIVGLDES